MNGFGISRKLSWSHDWWFGFCWRVLWSHLRFLPITHQWFWNKHDATVNPLLMVWDFRRIGVTPFTHFSKDILMGLNSQDVDANPFAHFANAILHFSLKKWWYFEGGGRTSFAALRRPLAVCDASMRAPLETCATSRVRFEGSIRWLDASIIQCWRLAWTWC